MMKDLGLGVHAIEGSLSMLPGVSLPLRSTILESNSGEVVVVSPVGGVASWGPKVAALGPVRTVVAPNGFHHMYLQDAWNHFTSASRWTSVAVRGEFETFPPNVIWLAGEDPWTLADGVVAMPVLGMERVQEWVLFHERSKTLVVTDLLFNILEPGFGLGLAQRFFGTYKKLAVSKLFMRACTDRRAFTASLRAIEELGCERLVMAHGEPVLSGAGEQVREAFRAAP